MNVIDNPKLHIGDLQFKMMIATSLSASWDTFTKPYMGGHIDAIKTDPKKLMSSQEFIDVIKEEYLHRKN